ncbi:MAG: FAD-linked oxidase C-terminal domain-containing protein [Gemmataceae bacterium]
MTDFIEQQRHELLKHLRANVQGEVRFDLPSRKLYSTDASIYQVEPLGVVIPRTVEDVVATVQIAGQTRVPITPRGGGTSLSGQSIGPGVVLDCSKYLNRVLDIDPGRRVARVQPGVVLDTFNRVLGEHDLQFGPDVSTSSRANLGGLMGNNSAGARSIVYGKTIDHVLSQTAILFDGSKVVAGPLDAAGWEAKARAPGLEGSVYRDVRRIVRDHYDEIFQRFPRILRRVSGYNLDVLAGVPLPRAPEAVDRPPGLHHLLVGSEGTLAVVVEAEVNLVPRPKVRGLLVPQFATMADAMDALAACLELQPSAVEVMDHILLDLTAGNLALRDATKPIDRRAKAIFMVEFSSDDEREVQDKVEKMHRRLRGVNGLVTAVPAIDPAVRDPLWNLRRASMPLLYSMVGDAKPVTFIEDPAVPPEKLPEFVARFREILNRHGTDGSFYGHASVGCLHIRPVMNLKDRSQVATMRRIMEEVSDLVLLYGGSLSGEHGDGLARSEWNRKMYGPALYEAFRELKRAFDPHGVLNPGRVVDAPPMTENLRYPPGYRPAEPVTVFDYSKQEGFLRSVEMCNGSGACRKTTGGAMCPSYRATLDERDSTRGRANALRHALAMDGPMADPRAVPRTLRQRWVHEVFDLCLMCKACKAECPSNVDVGKQKAEFLQFYYRERARPLEHLIVAGVPWFNRLAAPLAPLVNWAQTRRVTRWLLEKAAGIDRRRSLPPLHRRHFRGWFRRHRPDANAGRAGKVLLLADCFTTYNEPSVGAATVRVLERAGYAVELADVFCCGRVFLSKGFLYLAKARVQAQVGALARRVAGGTPILGMEPSCILTLADEWPELLPGAPTRAVAGAAKMADSWLAEQVRSGRCELPLSGGDEKAILHGHCHQKALLGVGASAPALRLAPGLDVQVLDAGCCGMAGSFGFEREHFDVSERIANLALLPALARQPDRVVVAPGTSCRHQIHDLAGRRALHPMEVLAARLPAG